MARVHHKAAPQSARESRARVQKTEQTDGVPGLLSRVWLVGDLTRAVNLHSGL